MKKNFINIILVTCLLLSSASYAQVTDSTNTSTNLTEYLGWNNLGTSKSLDLYNYFTGSQ